MARAEFEVLNYRVVLAGRLKLRDLRVRLAGYIVCSGDEATMTVYFADGDDMPANEYHPESKTATAYVPSGLLGTYLDVLRNERPVMAHVDSEEPQLNRLTTGPEPVGEAERVIEILEAWDRERPGPLQRLA